MSTLLVLLAAVAVTVPDSPRPAETNAAAEYVAWVGQLGGKAPDLVIRRDESWGEDGFRLQNEAGKLVVSGGRRGVLYGVYEALERFGGIRWLAVDTTVVPKKRDLRMPARLDETNRPAFELRQPYWFDVNRNPDFAARLRVNAPQIGPRHGDCTHRFDTVLGNCHTFDKLVPVAEYFDKHPEYFSEVKGKRVRERTQLCLTNPDVFKIVLAKVRERIKANPSARYFGISQNDWWNYCTCPKCAAIDAEEESHAGTVIRFVNAIADEIAKEFPDKVIETLAYQYSRKPPKKTRVRPNVMPCLCSIECGFNTPLAESDMPANKSFVEDMRGWAAQTDQLYVWDYTTDFAYYFYPFPNVMVLQDNIKFFRENKVKSLFEQGAYQGRHGDFAELKAYLLAKWMWNPDINRNQLLATFFDGYYGKAARPVRRYFDALHASKRQPDSSELSIYESVYSFMLSDDFLDYATTLWDEAETLVKDSPLHARNVRMGRLTVDLTRLLRHRNAKARWPEWRVLARRVLATLEECPSICLSETRGCDAQLREDIRKMAANDYDALAKNATLATVGRHPVVALDRFFFEDYAVMKLQVHVKGGGFKAGVDDWDSVYRHGDRTLSAAQVGKDWKWVDVLTWHIGEGMYFWFSPEDGKTEIDAVRLVPGDPKDCDKAKLKERWFPRAIRAAKILDSRVMKFDDGLTLGYAYCASLFGHTNELYALKLELDKTRFRPTLREGGVNPNMLARLKRTSTAAAMMDAPIAVNGGFFEWKKLVPYYAMKLNGQMVKGSGGGNFGMAWSNDGSKVHVGHFDTNKWDNCMAGEGIYANGYSSIGWKRKHKVKPDAPHTFHGTDAANKVWWTFQNSGRRAGRATCSWGLDYTDCADVMMWFGCKNGVMQDGGGSSAIVVHESLLRDQPKPYTPEAHLAGNNAPGYWILNRPSDFNGTERAVLDQVVFKPVK